MICPLRTFVIFLDGHGFTRKILKKGFVHIQILLCDGFNWILIDPTFTHLEWYILPIAAKEDPFREYVPDGKIIKMHQCPVKKKIWVGRIGILSCVLIARYYLGIHKSILTPYRLYRFILNNNLGEDYGRKIW